MVHDGSGWLEWFRSADWETTQGTRHRSSVYRSEAARRRQGAHVTRACVRVVISNWRVGIAAQKINRCWQEIANTDLTCSRGLDANANLRLIVRSNEEVLLDGNTTSDGPGRAAGISMISSDLISTSSSDTRNYTFYLQLTPKSYS